MSEKKRIHINLIGTSGRSGKLGGGKTRNWQMFFLAVLVTLGMDK